MKITINHLAAISRYAHKLEELDGPPNEARKQPLHDLLGRFQLTEEHLSSIEKRAENMYDDQAEFYIKDFDRDYKLIVAELFSDIVCSDGEFTELGSAAVWEVIDHCNLVIPGYEDRWKEEQVENIPLPNAPMVPTFLQVRPNGIASFSKSDKEDWRDLSKQIAEWIGVTRTEVVRFTAPLNEISKRLRLKGCHVVFLVDANGYAIDADDNMTGTILYGGRVEILGNILIALETDDGYKLEGFRNNTLLTDTYFAICDAVGGLLHYQSN